MNELIASQGMSFTSISRGILGMLALITIAYIFSSDRKSISWKVVGIGLFMQLVIAISVLHIPFVEAFFNTVGGLFVKVMDFTKAGTSFLLASFVSHKIDTPLINFAFVILPTIIFFSALTSVLFFLGVIQKVVKGLAMVLTKTLNVSGAEGLSVAGNIFLGQTEAPLMIKAYLEKMNKSEIMLVMIGGMATVAGGVLAAYVNFLGGDDPIQQAFYAKHLLSASVMAAPGAVVIAKMLMPQSETIDNDLILTEEKTSTNFLDAMATGTTEGLKLAMSIGAMLLTFFAFIAMANYILKVYGHYTTIVDWLGAIALAVSYVFYKKANSSKIKSFLLTFISLLFIVILFRYLMAKNIDGYQINNSINHWVSSHTNYPQLSMEFILGYTFAPLMWLIGVAKEDMTMLGQLLGIKLIASEFVGYINLAEFKDVGNAMHLTYEKSVIIATYMLCGFANFASIGIQVGGISQLAPGQRKNLSKFGMKALLGGTLASLLSANFAGMLIG